MASPSRDLHAALVAVGLFSTLASVSAFAQATTPAPLVPPQPNWTTNDPQAAKSINEVLDHPEWFSSPTHTYTEVGPLGMPKLIWTQEIDNIIMGEEPRLRRPVAHPLFFASGSCRILDVDAKKAGAWGPECKITKYITMPSKGKLSPPTFKGAYAGEYMYTPHRAGAGTDMARFILENGAGKKVDVTVKIKINKWTPEANVGSDKRHALADLGLGIAISEEDDFVPQKYAL